MNGFLTRADVLHGDGLDGQLLVHAKAAVAHRGLSQQTDLHHPLHGQMEVAHHVEIFAVHRVMERKVVPHAAHLEPCGVAFQIAAIGVVGITLGDHAHRRMGAEVRQLVAALGPAGFVLHHHDRGGIVGILEIVGHLDPQHKIAFHLGVVVGRIAKGLRQDAFFTFIDAAVEEVGLPGSHDLDAVVGQFDFAFVQPLKIHVVHLQNDIYRYYIATFLSQQAIIAPDRSTIYPTSSILTWYNGIQRNNNSVLYHPQAKRTCG